MNDDENSSGWALSAPRTFARQAFDDEDCWSFEVTMYWLSFTLLSRASAQILPLSTRALAGQCSATVFAAKNFRCFKHLYLCGVFKNPRKSFATLGRCT